MIKFLRTRFSIDKFLPLYYHISHNKYTKTRNILPNVISPHIIEETRNIRYELGLNMKQSYFGLKTSFLFLSVFIFLIGCNPKKDSGIPDFEDDISEHSPGPISENLTARIYFDATLSMQGFVVPGSTRYTQMCRYLESVIVSGWGNATVNFYRFGEQVEEIDRSTYLNLSKTGFYEDSRIFRETFIQKIIDHEVELAHEAVEENAITEESTETVTVPDGTNNIGKETPLVVIVTDLFQDNRDLTVLVSQIKEQYIQKGYEVGILGLRSEFDGTVYDLGDAPLPYRSTPGNPETYRPLYLLVLGRHADISHYFDRLKAVGFSDETNGVNTIIFSRYLAKPLLSFDGAEEIIAKNLNNKIIKQNHSQNTHLRQYEIVNSSEPAKISVIRKYDPLPHAMSFDVNTFKNDIVAKHAPMGETQESPDAQRCLEVKSKLTKNSDSNELSAEFTLNSRALLGSVVYLYEVILRPEISTYRAPDWCSKWDMGDERNGAKTLNLVNFVRGLMDTTVNEHKPKIAQFYFYIKKR